IFREGWSMLETWNDGRWIFMGRLIVEEFREDCRGLLRGNMGMGVEVRGVGLNERRMCRLRDWVRIFRVRRKMVEWWGCS
ncbi:hypothetical protein, partial [Paenibacillus xylanexedens]|uniref:hypothetical protein n=1 Tax=Paenibacillus xylanexedens TaxID=528191 RepID=UPI001C92D9E7